MRPAQCEDVRIAILEEPADAPVELDRRGVQTGDVKRTSADTTRARRTLGWEPAVGLREGLASELDWVTGRRATV
jgi:UDP-glucuronate 4-epimerase